ncbi:MAG: flagellar protein FlgN [Methylophilus sp.]|nr:flagellar protein FlgN [Methylophilus sp.]
MSQSTAKLTITFEQDAQLVTYLIADLQNEQSALIKSDIHAIEALVDKRLLLLQQLSMAAKNRYDALAANGFEANEKGMLDWLNVQAKPVLTNAWKSFQKSLAQAKEMNRLNGILISKHFNRNQQLLSHLQGDARKADIYGKNGQAKSQNFLRGPLSV